MRHISPEIVYSSRTSTIDIMPIGDVHLGHANCDETLLKEAVERIRSKRNTYWIGMGDMMECIWRKDKRHVESCYAPWLWGQDQVLRAQRERLNKYLKPIARKCLGYLWGNHEMYAQQKLGAEVYPAFLGELDKDTGLSLGIHGFITLKLRRASNGNDVQNYHIYAHHGYGGGNLAGSKALKLERLPARYDASLYLMGHMHATHVLSGLRTYPPNKGGGIQQRQWRAACTGSFLRTIVEGQEMYAEAKGLTPLPVGYPVVTITPATLETRVTV